jgi:diguanylate cyclase (GGDEF)-like protein
MFGMRGNVLTGRRASGSIAGPFVVAAALVGGPLLGACAGAAIQLVTRKGVWRGRAAYASAGAVQGFVVGAVGEHLTQGGTSGAVVTAIVGLLTGCALNIAAIVFVAHGRGLQARAELVASWREILVTWCLPAPLLVVFLYLFQTTPPLALAYAAGLLLLLAVGQRLQLGLERTLAQERSRARVDALTNAPNRYALAEALTAEQARMRRGGRPAGICFLDLDRFKSVNDTYGYAAGDRLLVDVYQRLRGELRASDVVFRWGGEEFVVLAPHLEAPELANFAERLRLLLESRPFAIDGRPRTVTASVGAALLEESRPADVALEAASRLVKKAKLTRNTAVVESPRERAAKAQRPRAASA